MRFVLLYGGAGGTPTYKGVVDYFQPQGVDFSRTEAVELGKVILQNVIVPIMSEVHGDDDSSRNWLDNHDLLVVGVPEAGAPAAAEAQPAAEQTLIDMARAEAEKNPNNACCRYFSKYHDAVNIDAAAAAAAAATAAMAAPVGGSD